MLVFLFTASAHAITYEIQDADLTEWLSWNFLTVSNFPNGRPNETFDNDQGCDLTSEGSQNFCTPIFASSPDWLAPDGNVGVGPYLPVPVTFPTSYSGTITTDEQGNVTGGSLVTTGLMGFHLSIGGNSAMFGVLSNVAWDLATGDVISGTFTCHMGDIGRSLSPEFCTGQQPGGSTDTSSIRLTDGNESLIKAARKKAIFNPQTGELKLFHEGYCCSSINPFDIDHSMKFSATTAIVPLPAGAWLFISENMLAMTTRR
jgi:hypothetical protein